MDGPDSPFRAAGRELDSWQRRSGMAGAPRLPLCSYCGSLRPEEFLAGLRNGSYFVGPTDKSYKIYVHAENGTRIAELGDQVSFPAGPTVAKFYTKHLSEDQAWELWQMWDSGTLPFGYPGGFYRQIYLPGVLERLHAGE